jgi:hypothetical protein
LPGLCVPRSWLLNVRLAGEKLTGFVTVPVPEPERLATCGLSGALSLTVNAPGTVPFTVGVKVMLMVQVPLAPMDPVQVLFEIEYSPLVVTLENASNPPCKFVRTIVFATLVLPIGVEGKLTVAGANITGPTAVPLKLTI